MVRIATYPSLAECRVGAAGRFRLREQRRKLEVGARNSAHVRDDGALADVSRVSARTGRFSKKSYAGPNACTPKGEKHMQPGYPQGSYVTEIGCATRTVKTDRGRRHCKAVIFNQSYAKWGLSQPR